MSPSKMLSYCILCYGSPAYKKITPHMLSGIPYKKINKTIALLALAHLYPNKYYCPAREKPAFSAASFGVLSEKT